MEPQPWEDPNPDFNVRAETSTKHGEGQGQTPRMSGSRKTQRITDVRKEQEIPADPEKNLEFSEMRNTATEVRHITSNFNSRLGTTKERSTQQRDGPRDTLRNLLREMTGRGWGGCETGVRRCGGHRTDRVRIGTRGQVCEDGR